MKHLIYLAFLVVSAITQAQSNFEQGMGKALNLMEAGNFEKSEQLLERIASAEKNEWLPHYYIAQINSLKSWNQKDETLLRAQLEKAQKHLDQAFNIEESNPELLIMQAQILTNWVAYDGMTYGMKYGQKISELYIKANKLQPENPRAVFCKAEWEIGSARYFGQDTKPFCKQIEKSIELFANFQTESDYYPSWGLDRANRALTNCTE